MNNCTRSNQHSSCTYSGFPEVVDITRYSQEPMYKHLNSCNIVHIDQLILSHMDTPDNITSLVEYNQRSVEIINSYKQLLQTPLKITFTDSGVIEESDASKTEIIKEYITCVYDTIPNYILNTIQPLLSIITPPHNIVNSNQCPFCDSPLVMDEDCSQCQHVDVHYRINNSYTDLGRINMTRKTDQKYREALCDRTLQELEGRCTTAIPVGVLIDIVNMILASRRDKPTIDESFITNIHEHSTLFKNVTTHDVYNVVSRLPESYTKYRLTYQVNYIQYFLANLPIKDLQSYRTRILNDVNLFDIAFMSKYPNKHMINIQYFIYEKFKEYKVPDISLDDFFPLRCNYLRYECSDLYESVKQHMVNSSHSN